jgi:ribosomal protein S18 acetylase RimI-like enzyme
VRSVLDNAIWHTLTGRHAAYACGTGAVRRYANGFSPMLGFADPECPRLDQLAPHCVPGEHLYCSGWPGVTSAGWSIVAESTMFQLVWQGGIPEVNGELPAIRLGPQHASQALELASLTRPGPFGLRTPELGEYFGYFDGSRLVAMAGERLHAGVFREISGVCTHPDYQGRGMARRLMMLLIRRQLQRGETPFLHVISENASAHDLYQRMGFVDHRESVVRIIARC